MKNREGAELAPVMRHISKTNVGFRDLARTDDCGARKRILNAQRRRAVSKTAISVLEALKGASRHVERLSAAGSYNHDPKNSA
jgi:hypothetical protein